MNKEKPSKKNAQEEVPEKKKVPKKNWDSLKIILLAIVAIIVYVGLMGYMIFTMDQERKIENEKRQQELIQEMVIEDKAKALCETKDYSFVELNPQGIMCKEIGDDFEVYIHTFSIETIE